jgi:hypothetical protein
MRPIRGHHEGSFFQVLCIAGGMNENQVLNSGILGHGLYADVFFIMFCRGEGVCLFRTAFGSDLDGLQGAGRLVFSL